MVAVASNAEQFALGETGTPPGRNVLAIEGGLTPGENEAPEVPDPVEVPESVVIVIASVLGIGLLYLLSSHYLLSHFVRILSH